MWHSFYFCPRIFDSMSITPYDLQHFAIKEINVIPHITFQGDIRKIGKMLTNPRIIVSNME